MSQWPMKTSVQSQRGIILVNSLPHSPMENPLDFLLIQPMYLPLLSFFLNLVLLLILFGSWVYNKKVACENSDDFMAKRSTKMSSTFSKLVVMCCVSLSVFYSVLSLLSCVRWHSNVWTLFDLLLAALTWGAISMYLRGLYTDSHEQKLPYLLRVWWVLYVLLSCYRLVVDFVLYKKQELVSVHIVVSDLVGVCAGLLLCCSCLWKQGEGERNNLLEEPLLIENEVCDDEVTTPFSKAGFLSLVSFSWMSPLVTLGNEKIIDSKDVPQVDSSDRAENLFRVFRSKLEWDDGERRITTFKLVKALFLSVWRDILLSFIFAFVSTMSCYVAPYLMDSFVQYLNGQRQYKHQGYVLVTVFFVAKLVECQTRRHWYFRGGKAGLGMKAVLVSMIYEKGLTLPCHSKQGQGQTSGEIINLMAVDADRLDAFTWFMHDPWILVLQVSLALWILYNSLGHGSVAAFPAFILVMLANYPFAKLEDKFQSNLMKSKDNRMKKTSEVLLNMRILKLQGWEMKFLSKILDLRHVEAGWLKKFVYNSAAMSSVLLTAPSFISATAFGACVLLKIPLESGKILAALAIFQILQSPIYKLPETISMFVQVKVSLARIASFLCLDDLRNDVVERLTYSEMALEVRNGCFSWDDSSSIPTLREVSFEVSQGMNVAVCGTVGSGKSSLLSSILGEVPKISGTVKVYGRKAYVAQSPWIQSGKVEDNILFGKPMERDWYERVLEACCLNKDLELLPFHDQTVVGERGINLSGGQKQRIQIARALYQNADIYLFDDPFSAVDAHTGSHLFKEVILGILKDKTVIYVTHQVEFLPEADLILVMKEGKITQAGRYNEILDSGTDFMELVGAHTDALATVDTYEQGCDSSESTTNKEKEAPRDEEKLEKDSGKPRGGQLVQQEEREKGKVGFTVYKKYMALAYGGAVIPIILLVQILFQVLDIGSNYWMTWVTPVSKDVEPWVSGFTLILVYVVLAIASSLCILVRTLLVSMTGFKMATELFTQMHLRVFRASMSFFDVTPMGRILNRASTDQSVVDLSLPGQFAYVAVVAINILGIMGVMIHVAWQVLIIFIPVVAASSWYRQYYISAARELARLAGISRSPLVHHFSETLSGVTTIRSFDQEPRFLSDIMKLSDCLSRLAFHSTGATEWLCFRLELLATIAFALSLVIVVSAPDGTVNPSFAGLAITYALNLNNLQSNLVWTLCELENKMISVERMLQYIDIPSEPSLVIESTRPEKSWPSHGEITISNLQVRYGPHLPMVLHGLTCTFPGGLKTGIVGRTGCGKSTLIQTLFRIVEPTAGEIRIDGIDILTIGLHDLRSRLSIIPQDPTMFEGTVRSNLDPLEEYSDDQIWEALDKCQLGVEVRKKELKLDSPVSENGQNWSVGQRQLVCLGRVLLKSSKVLVLDEATASVDTATDNLIQETLRQHFADCTVITIAHRISSVIDSDMVLLLDQGLIKEHDSPARLLEDKSSSFSKLVAEYTTSSESKFSSSC
ncbi:ABC transporter C family member 6 [Brassica rapa]|uniref:ABC transporter C family member 6 n=1 Tax=Brassica campestris TaxID=3711 RepID=UPI00142E2B58|nr:ABC transporter C family member 6 [Brassica rapa]